MKTTGYYQPLPETRELWQQLTEAKAAGDRELMGKLSGQIQRATVEVQRDNRQHAAGNVDSNHSAVVGADCVVGDKGA